VIADNVHHQHVNQPPRIVNRKFTFSVGKGMIIL
jgi:hypothetical protein